MDKLWYIHAMECYSSIKRINYWYRQQCGWISKQLHWVKETRQKRGLYYATLFIQHSRQCNVIHSDRKQIGGCLGWQLAGILMDLRKLLGVIYVLFQLWQWFHMCMWTLQPFNFKYVHVTLSSIHSYIFFFENTSRGLLKYYFSVSEQSASSGLWVEIFLEVYPHKLKFKWFVLIYVLLVFEVVYLKLNIVSL